MYVRKKYIKNIEILIYILIYKNLFVSLHPKYNEYEKQIPSFKFIFGVAVRLFVC